MGVYRDPRRPAANHLAIKLALVGFVGVNLVFGTPEAFTAKHLLILATALLIVFGMPWLKAFLVRMGIL